MNHKLRVLVRVDVDPGRVTLEATGCLTQANYPVLLHIMRRGRRLAPDQGITVDLRSASHLDPEVLMYLRHIAGRDGGGSQTPTDRANGSEAFQLRLVEPAELPVCLEHAGLTGGEVGLDGELDALLGGQTSPAPDPDGALAAAGEQRTVNGLELSEYLEGNLDPAATLRALSDEALGRLADALYRHLDTPSPSFGAHTWYELAAEELHHRHLTEPEGPSQAEIAAG
ncbi:hypothetical protein FCN77_01570 [Arthrobacter sp. 24S4-2]|uniref:hypothetical protein n=1 Tax=Arthrobacter sp. 24S4-2 TaxID=2575374 RepID=UPI0010C77C3A|nr:hypothetical protein [Arthrobacter sp. 24S4-2]QCO96645.1 hypothetical protein FCN77_01570 [Arthrobacter sp. 24S4-2]